MIPKIVFVSFFVSLLCVLVSYAVMKKEQIKRWQVKNINIERAIKVVIHYDTTRTKTYYRLIPNDKVLKIDDVMYHYDRESTINPEDIFSQTKKTDTKNVYFKIQDKEYKLDIRTLEKRAEMFGNDNLLEIHYWYNVPTPINFDVKKQDLILSAKQMQDMKDNDLFAKLLRLDEQNMLLMIILICVILVVVIVGFNAYLSYDTNKILKDYIKMVTAPAVESAFLFWFTTKKIK